MAGASVIDLIKAIVQRALAGLEDEGGLRPALQKAVRLIRAGGLRTLLLGEAPYLETEAYRRWVREVDTLTDEEIAMRNTELRSWTAQPVFSILLPVYKTPLPLLRSAVQSVKEQIYPHWELCISDDFSNDPQLYAELKEVATDARVKLVMREINGHISANSNTALAMAQGDWVVLLDHDDQLSIDALYEVAKAINEQPATRLIYSDEDKIDSNGLRSAPNFKPDFNLELLRAHNYVCHLTCARREDVRAVGGFTLGMEGAQDHDLVLKLTERLKPGEICHIPKILYHWRLHPQSTSRGIGAKPYAIDAGSAAARAHLGRLGIAAKVDGARGGYQRVHYDLPAEFPLVSIIVLEPSHASCVAACVESIQRFTDYPDFEIAIVSSCGEQSDTPDQIEPLVSQGHARVERSPEGTSKAEAFNRAVELSSGEFVLFLDASIRITDANWLSQLVAMASQQDVGAVGAKIVTGSGTVCHAGFMLGLGATVAQPFCDLDMTGHGHNLRLRVNHEAVAVSADCLLVRKQHFEKAGQFDASVFPDRYFDIDFCLKLVTRGFRNVVCVAASVCKEGEGEADQPSPEQSGKDEKTAALRLAGRWWKYVNTERMYNPHWMQSVPLFRQQTEISPRRSQVFGVGRHRFGLLLTPEYSLSESLVFDLYQLLDREGDSLQPILAGPRARELEAVMGTLFPGYLLLEGDQYNVPVMSAEVRAGHPSSSPKQLLFVFCGVATCGPDQCLEFDEEAQAWSITVV